MKRDVEYKRNSALDEYDKMLNQRKENFNIKETMALTYCGCIAVKARHTTGRPPDLPPFIINTFGSIGSPGRLC